MRDPLGRMIRIQRHIRTACRDDRVHADDQVQRTPDRQSHQRLRADSLRNQQPGKLVDLLIELAIGKRRALVVQRDGPRMCRRRPPIPVQQQLGSNRVPGLVPLEQNPRSLGGRQQIDLTDGALRMLRNPGEQPLEAVRELRDRRLVEQLRGIGELRGEPTVFLGHDGQLQIELGHRTVEIDRVRGQSG
ncbi:hypothetical protein GCM10023319_25450 [Nocardia iowensis]